VTKAPPTPNAYEPTASPVQHRQWDGHLHGFLGDPGTYDDTEPALDEIASAIRTALTPGD